MCGGVHFQSSSPYVSSVGMCSTTHLCAWQDSFLCDMTYLYVCQDLFICGDMPYL